MPYIELCRVQYLQVTVVLILHLLNTTPPEEASWSGSALFVIKYVNFYQKPGSSNLIGWKLEVGMAS